MDEIINLEMLAKDGDKLMEQLGLGRLVVLRSKNDFLFVYDFKNEFHLFSHTPGSPGGGRKLFPKDEKYTAVVKNLISMADSAFSVEFEKELDLYGVLASAEEAILSMFPGDSREFDEDVEFVIPGEETDEETEGDNSEGGL